MRNPKIKVVIVNGAGGCGKDTFVNICSEILGIGKVLNISSVTPAKDVAKEKYGWDGVDKGDYWRTILVRLKEEQIADNDLPTRYVVGKALDFDGCLVFIHIRESEEIQKCINSLSSYGISILNNSLKVLLITNSNINIPNTKADQNVKNGINYTDKIDNSGTISDLKTKAKNFLSNWNLIENI